MQGQAVVVLGSGVAITRTELWRRRISIILYALCAIFALSGAASWKSGWANASSGPVSVDYGWKSYCVSFGGSSSCVEYSSVDNSDGDKLDRAGKNAFAWSLMALFLSMAACFITFRGNKPARIGTSVVLWLMFLFAWAPWAAAFNSYASDTSLSSSDYALGGAFGISVLSWLFCIVTFIFAVTATPPVDASTVTTVAAVVVPPPYMPPGAQGAVVGGYPGPGPYGAQPAAAYGYGAYNPQAGYPQGQYPPQQYPPQGYPPQYPAGQYPAQAQQQQAPQGFQQQQPFGQAGYAPVYDKPSPVQASAPEGDTTTKGV